MLNGSEFCLQLLEECIHICLRVRQLVSILIDPLLELRGRFIVLILDHLFDICADVYGLPTRVDVVELVLCRVVVANLVVSHHVVVLDSASICLVDSHAVHYDHVISIEFTGHCLHIVRDHIVYISTHDVIVTHWARPLLGLLAVATLLTYRLKDILRATIWDLLRSTKHLLLHDLLLLSRCLYSCIPIVAHGCQRRWVVLVMILPSCHL